MATPVFRLEPPASGSTCTSPDAKSGSRKCKATSICVLPAEGGKSTVTCNEVPVVNKSKPSVSAKPQISSKLETRPTSDTCYVFLDDSPLSTKEFGILPTATTSTFTFGSSRTSKRDMSLSELSSAYSSTLPVTVQVASSGSSKLPLSTGDVLHVLAIKSITVVSARSNTHNFVIPLNSSIPLSVQYDPESNTKKTLEGHVFTNARALSLAKVLPKVVCVTEPPSALRGTDARVKPTTSVGSESHADSIVNGEILVLNQTEIERELYGCKAFSLKSKTTKLLSDDRKFSFSTCPELVSMFLSDIVQLIADHFPLKVAMTGKKAVPPKINPTDITLLKVTTEQSLVCFNGSCRANLIDIPVTESAIQVIVDEANCSKNLCKQGAEMMQNFEVNKLVYIRNPEIQEVQAFFYSQVRPGDETTGVKLTIPLSITEHMKNPSKSKAATPKPQMPALEEPTSSMKSKVKNSPSSNTHFLPSKPAINRMSEQSNSYAKSSFSMPNEMTKSRHKTFDTKDKAVGHTEVKTKTSPMKSASLEHISACHQSLKSDPISIKSSTPSIPAFSLNKTCDTIHVKDVSMKYAVRSSQVAEEDYQPQPMIKEQSESPPLYDTFSGITMKKNSLSKSVETMVQPHQMNASTLPQVGNKCVKPPPPKPYEKPVSVKAPPVIKTSVSEPHSFVTTLSDAGFDIHSIDKDNDTDDEIEGYTYVLMNPKDSNLKQNSSSLVSEIRNDNKQYLSSLSMVEVQSMLVANGLEQYLEVFRKERIDGGILSLLGDDDLRLELRIESRLHRLRLLRIISGDVNIKSH